jgi:hypothetical protein
MKASEKQIKEAYRNGVADKMEGYKKAYDACKKMKGNPCAEAYVRGYENSGAGE